MNAAADERFDVRLWDSMSETGLQS